MPRKNPIDSDTPATPAAPPGMEHLKFTPVGTPTSDPHGVKTQMFRAEVPGGSIVWVSRTHTAQMTGHVAISDALCFVPKEG